MGKKNNKDNKKQLNRFDSFASSSDFSVLPLEIFQRYFFNLSLVDVSLFYFNIILFQHFNIIFQNNVHKMYKEINNTYFKT